MENTISERFRSLIKELGKTNNSFAKSLEKNSSTIQYIVDGKSKPSFDVMDAIFAKYPNVNPTWLMTGEGEKFKDVIETEKATGYDIVEKIDQFLSNKYEKIIEEKNSIIADQRFMIELFKGQLGKHDVSENTTCKIIPFAPLVELQTA